MKNPFVSASNLGPQTGIFLRLGENPCAALLRGKMIHFRIGRCLLRIRRL